MKKMLFAFLLTSITVSAFAQNDKYVKAMEAKVAAFDTTRSVAGLNDLSNAFERIATAEKSQWLPYYYAALSTINQAYSMLSANGGDAAKLDPLADKAEALINTADALSPNNSEIYLVKKMINSVRFMVDPQARYMQYAPIAQQALETAKKLNPENPRVCLLEGQDKFFTPAQFGGSKSEAKKLFELAMQKFDASKPATTIDPSWGKATTQYFLAQANQ